MSQLGRQLIDLHLLQAGDSVLSAQYSALGDFNEAAPPAFPCPAAEANLPYPIANFRAGGYVALRKWLQPKHRSECDPQYARIVAAISRTNEIMAAIDATIDQSGGWARAFCPQQH
jgi:hypothetical protein